MQQQWSLIVADYRREYGISADDLAAMSLDEFQWLLNGLSRHSRFLRAWGETPKHIYDPDEIAAVKAAARR